MAMAIFAVDISQAKLQELRNLVPKVLCTLTAKEVGDD
jgi:hypothetical protein